MDRSQSRLRAEMEYRITPSPDAEVLIKQVVSAGIPRSIAERAIVKYDAEVSARKAYS